MMKKLCTLLLASALLLSSASVARAQTLPWYLPTPLTQIEKMAECDQNQVTSSCYLMYVSSTIFNSVIGMISTGERGTTGTRGAVPELGHAIATLVGNPPVDTAQYLAYMGQKAGFVDQAYAQEGGFGVLQPIQSMWVATRNVAYLITSLTLVVIGFMIMMRKKLDAQTVIGIQQALPSIVITLLLITFSYAIAGFVVDLIYFIIYFVIGLLGANIFTDQQKALDILRTKSIFTLGLQDLFNLGGGAGASSAQAIADLVDSIFTSGPGTWVSGALSWVVKGSIGQLIVAGAILFVTVKIFFALLTSYAMLLMTAIFGPLMLMTNAVPGSNAFGSWIKNLAGNAAVFPATAIFLVFAAALMGNASGDWGIRDDIGFGGALSKGDVAWTPPLLFGEGGGTTNPTQALMALVGLGMLLLTPQFIEMVKKAFQTAGGEGYGSAIGQALQYGYSGRFSPGRLASGPLGFGGALAQGGLGVGSTLAMQEFLKRNVWARNLNERLNPSAAYQTMRLEQMRAAQGAGAAGAAPSTPSTPATPRTTG